jgi:hypothetical protein
MVRLTDQDQQTYDSIFRHPVSGNIEWHAILQLFKHLGEVTDEPNGKTKIVVNGHTLTLHTHGKDLELVAIQDVKHFLKASETLASVSHEKGDYLLVLDHSDAKVFSSAAENTAPTHIEPYDPHGWEKHVHDTHVTARRYTTALHHEFYENIALALRPAERILVFCAGKGSSQEFDHMLQDLNGEQFGVASRVVGVIDLDLSHMTEGQLLARARIAFEKHEPVLT